MPSRNRSKYRNVSSESISVNRIRWRLDLGKRRRIRRVKYHVHALPPSELSKEEIAKCLSVIERGNAVDYSSAARQLPLARVVAIVPAGQQILGVGAIKQPRPHYASEVSRHSEFPFDKNMLV